MKMDSVVPPEYEQVLERMRELSMEDPIVYAENPRKIRDLAAALTHMAACLRREADELDGNGRGAV